MAAELRNSAYQKYLLNIMALYKQRQDLKAYLEILLSIATIGMFVIFAIKPTLVTIGDLITKINTEQDTSNALDTKIKNLSLAQQAYTNETSNINLLRQGIPDGPDVPTYIRQIEGLLKKENLTEVSLSVSQVNLQNASQSATTSSNAVNVTVTTTGVYSNLKNFLQEVENLRRPAIVSKLDIALGDNNNLNLTISPQAPFQP